MNEKEKLEKLAEFKELCEKAINCYPSPPLATCYRQNLEELVGMADMYIIELKEDLEEESEE